MKLACPPHYLSPHNSSTSPPPPAPPPHLLPLSPPLCTLLANPLPFPLAVPTTEFSPLKSQRETKSHEQGNEVKAL